MLRQGAGEVSVSPLAACVEYLPSGQSDRSFSTFTEHLTRAQDNQEGVWAAREPRQPIEQTPASAAAAAAAAPGCNRRHQCAPLLAPMMDSILEFLAKTAGIKEEKQWETLLVLAGQGSPHDRWQRRLRAAAAALVRRSRRSSADPRQPAAARNEQPLQQPQRQRRPDR